MARPKGPEESIPLHTRLSASQHTGFREYLKRQQEQIKHTGVQLTEAAALRGMVLRCLDLENIAHSSAQQAITFASTAPSNGAASAAPPADAPAGDTAAAPASAAPSTEAPTKARAAKGAKAPAAKPKSATPASAKGAKKEPAAPLKGKVAAKPARKGAR